MSPKEGKPESLRIDQVCEAFEAVLRAGIRPVIEQFLESAPEAERTELFGELLALELAYRDRKGERPKPEDYLARFADRAEDIKAIFRQTRVQESARVEESSPVDGLVLTVTEGPHQGQTFTFTGHDTFLVGRSKHVHFQLPLKDKYFSRIHFMIEVNLPFCRLNDMRSHNGTFVNGQQVQSVDLHHGDRIRAGHTVLTVSLPHPPEPEKEKTAGVVPGEMPTVTLSPEPRTCSWVPKDDLEADATPPPAIPGYEIVRELGRGAMGIVYEAVRRADGEPGGHQDHRPGRRHRTSCRLAFPA